MSCPNYQCKCNCQNLIKNRCTQCNQINGSSLDPLVYQYYLETNWLNYNTTNGWGAFSGTSQTSNSTLDNQSGYGINVVSNPSNKKLKTIYIYNTVQYLNPYSIVIDNVTNLPTPVYEANGVKRIYRYITV